MSTRRPRRAAAIEATRLLNFTYDDDLEIELQDIVANVECVEDEEDLDMTDGSVEFDEQVEEQDDVLPEEYLHSLSGDSETESDLETEQVCNAPID